MKEGYIDKAIALALEELPPGYRISITIEDGEWIGCMNDSDGEEYDFSDQDIDIHDGINQAVALAIRQYMPERGDL